MHMHKHTGDAIYILADGFKLFENSTVVAVVSKVSEEEDHQIVNANKAPLNFQQQNKFENPSLMQPMREQKLLFL